MRTQIGPFTPINNSIVQLSLQNGDLTPTNCNLTLLVMVVSSGTLEKRTPVREKEVQMKAH